MKTEGLIGQKLGMTRVFEEDGTAVAVTVVSVPPNEVFSKKENSVAIGIMERKKFGKNINKKFKSRKEFKLAEGDTASIKIGDKIDLSMFQDKKNCRISAISKGKGFAGVIKRHNFSRGPETHGSDHHRRPGSVGACVTPGRVHRGKKLPGRMGNAKITLKKVEIVDVDIEKSIIALKGAIPGSKKGFVHIYTS